MSEAPGLQKQAAFLQVGCVDWPQDTLPLGGPEQAEPSAELPTAVHQACPAWCRAKEERES